MPKGIPLHKSLSKDKLLLLYKKNGSIEGIHKETGFDAKSLRNLLKYYNIPLKYKTKYSHDDYCFHENNELSYYWAGFLAADGCVKRNRIISLTLSSKDYDHLIKFKQFLKAEELIKKYRNSSYINIVSKEMAKDLERFNIFPRKTKTYTFPVNIDEKLIHHFMRGYFDGDGCISLLRNKYPYFSLRGTFDFLEKYQDEMMKNMDIKKNKIVFSGGIHSLSYGGKNNCRQIFEFLYRDATIYLERKFERFKNYDLYQKI